MLEDTHWMRPDMSLMGKEGELSCVTTADCSQQ